jgi:hypothetical protein
MARLVAAGVKLRDQVDERWPNRDTSSDGWIGDTDHRARPSDHNPDAQGWVHAIDIDKDGIDADALADQLIAYARNREPGSRRLKNVVFKGRVASGTYPDKFWTWRRDPSLGHYTHIHVSFTDAAETDGRPFPLDILESDMPLSDDDVKRIARAVWQHQFQTGWQNDGTFDPTKPLTVKAQTALSDSRGASRRAVYQGTPTTDEAAIADAVVDEIADRIGE